MKFFAPLLFILLLMALLLPPVRAQQAGSCSQTLRLARSVYEKGRLHEIPSLLEKCFNKKAGGFTKTERMEAFRLLTLSYLYSDEPQKADEEMLKLLREYNYYKPNKEVDPAEYVALYNTYRTEPVCRIGVKVGINAAKPMVISSDMANQAADRDSAGHVGYRPGISYMVGASAEIPLIRNLIFNPELYFFSRTFSGYNLQPGVQEVQLLSQNLKTLSLPLTIQYTINRKSFMPYAGVGLGINYLLQSVMQIQVNRINNQSIDKQTYTTTPYQNSLTFDGIAALGIRITVGPGKMILEARYWYGISNVNSRGQTYANGSTVWDYHYVDPIFKTGTGSFTLGYVLDVFKPKKKNLRLRAR